MSTRQFKTASKYGNALTAPPRMTHSFKLTCPLCKNQIERNMENHSTSIFCLGQGCLWPTQLRQPTRSPKLIKGSIKIKSSSKNRSSNFIFESIQATTVQNNLKEQTQKRFGIGSYSTQNWIDQQIDFIYKSNYKAYPLLTAQSLRFNIDNQHLLPLQIFESNIIGAGYGIRSTQMLQPNKIVMPYVGAIIKSNSYVPSSDSVFQFGWLKIQQQVYPLNLQPVYKLNAARFINSSFVDGKVSTNPTDFNCVMHFGIVDDQACLFLVTTRVIQPFEELIYSYNSNYILQKSQQVSGYVTRAIDEQYESLKPIQKVQAQNLSEKKKQQALEQIQQHQHDIHLSYCNEVIDMRGDHIVSEQDLMCEQLNSMAIFEDIEMIDQIHNEHEADLQQIKGSYEIDDDALLNTHGLKQHEDAIQTEYQLYQSFTQHVHWQFVQKRKRTGRDFKQSQFLKQVTLRWESLSVQDKQNLMKEYNAQITSVVKKMQYVNDQAQLVLISFDTFIDQQRWIQSIQYEFNSKKNIVRQDWIQFCLKFLWMQLIASQGDTYDSEENFDQLGLQNNGDGKYKCMVCQHRGTTKTLCMRRMVQHLKQKHTSFMTISKLLSIVRVSADFYILVNGFQDVTGLKINMMVAVTDCRRTFKSNVQSINQNQCYYIVQGYKLFPQQKVTSMRNYASRKQVHESTQISIQNSEFIQRYSQIIQLRQNTVDFDHKKTIYIVFGPHGIGKTHAMNHICGLRKGRMYINALQVCRVDALQADIKRNYRLRRYKGPLSIIVDQIDSVQQSKMFTLLHKLVQLMKNDIVNVYGICNKYTSSMADSFGRSGILIKTDMFMFFNQAKLKSFIQQTFSKYDILNVQDDVLVILCRITNIRHLKDVIKQILHQRNYLSDLEQLRKLINSQFNHNLSSCQQNLSPNQMIIISKILQAGCPFPKCYFERLGMQVDINDLIDMKVIKCARYYVSKIMHQSNHVEVVVAQDIPKKLMKMATCKGAYVCGFPINLLSVSDHNINFQKLVGWNKVSKINFVDQRNQRTQFGWNFTAPHRLFVNFPTKIAIQDSQLNQCQNYFDIMHLAFRKTKNIPQLAVSDMPLQKLGDPFGRAFFVRGPHGVGKTFLIQSKLMSNNQLDTMLIIDLQQITMQKSKPISFIIKKIIEKFPNQDLVKKQGLSDLQCLDQWFRKHNKYVALILKNVEFLNDGNKTIYQLAQMMTKPMSQRLSLVFIMQRLEYALSSKTRSRMRVVDIFMHRSEGPQFIKKILHVRFNAITHLMKQYVCKFTGHEIYQINNTILKIFEKQYLGTVSKHKSIDRVQILNKFEQFLAFSGSILQKFSNKKTVQYSQLCQVLESLSAKAFIEVQMDNFFTAPQMCVFAILLQKCQCNQLISVNSIIERIQQLSEDFRSSLYQMNGVKYVQRVLNDLVGSQHMVVIQNMIFSNYEKDSLVNLLSKNVNDSVPLPIRNIYKDKCIINKL